MYVLPSQALLSFNEYEVHNNIVCPFSDHFPRHLLHFNTGKIIIVFSFSPWF